MLIVAAILIPFLVSLLCFSAGNNSKAIALGGSLSNLVITIAVYMLFTQQQTALLQFNHSWIPAFGIHFDVGVDGLSLVMFLLTNLLVPFIVLSTFNHTYSKPGAFYGLMLLMQAGLVGVFVAKDAFLFYVFYELALIPIFFICAWWGGKDRIPVTIKFFIYTFAGSLFMLFGILYLYFRTPGAHTFEIEAFYKLGLSLNEQRWLFCAFFLAFAVKIPIVPFHSWQPETYTTAPAAGTMLLAGIMLKMGIYGLIRFIVPILPQGLMYWQWTVMILCVAGVIYGALIAIKQDDLKMLLAYSSLSHVGLIAAGVLSLNEQGMHGAIIQMLNHGISIVALFTLVDIIERRTGTRKISELGGLALQSKELSIIFMIVLLGAVALPLTNGFIGEFLLLFGVYRFNAILGAVAGLTIIFGAVYLFRMYRNVFFGEVANENAVTGFSWFEKSSLYILSALVIILGFFPTIISSVSNGSGSQILQFIKQHSTITGI